LLSTSAERVRSLPLKELLEKNIKEEIWEMEPLDMLGMGHRDKLPVQDALLTIAVCTAESGKKAGFSYIPSIVALAIADPLFSDISGKIESLKKRVYHLVNAITVGNQEKFVDLAITSLPSELKETAFAWAADVAIENGILANEKKQFLEALAAKLSIDSAVAERIIDVSAMGKRTLRRATADEKSSYQHEEFVAQ
jgi:D-ribose pyranose/furanose isomerase RbsD